MMKLARLAIVAAAILLASAFVTAQKPQWGQQQPSNRPGWPCVGKVDPSYIRTAEATGGKVLMFQTEELTGAAKELTASMKHSATVFRAGGTFADEAVEFQVPIDSTVESVYFFLSLQCMQQGIIMRANGDELRPDAPGVDEERYQAVRMVTVDAPAPGLWTVKLAGRGPYSVVVQAKSELDLSSVAFADASGAPRVLPLLGTPYRLSASVRGGNGDATFHFLNSGAEAIRSIALTSDGESGARGRFAGDVVTPKTSFRVAVTGTDPKGFLYERVWNQLFKSR